MIKQFFINSIAAFSTLFPLEFMKRKGNYPPAMPFYHTVSNTPLNYINKYPVRTEKQFKQELDFLLKYYKPVTLSEIIKNPSPEKMHLSFDDGLKECHSVIAPILKQKGIPATFFINPDFVDNQQIFHRFKQAILESEKILTKPEKNYSILESEILEKLAQQNNIDFETYLPYMSLNQIQELKADGFLIGAHSMNHPEMWKLSQEEQFMQIKNSMNWIVRTLNPELKVFAFPYTDNGVSLAIFEQLKSQNIIDYTFGTAGLKFDIAPNHYQRIPIENAQKWSIKKVMHFEYLYFFVRRILNKNIVKR